MRHTMLAIAAATALALTGCSSDGGDTGADADTATTEESSGETGGEDSGATDDTGGGDEAAAGGALTFTGTDDVAWASSEKSTGPGSTEITLDCGEAVPHGIAIEGVQGGEELAACDPGGSGSATVELEAGEYTFFCTVPGHRDSGMEGTLTVG